MSRQKRTEKTERGVLHYGPEYGERVRVRYESDRFFDNSRFRGMLLDLRERPGIISVERLLYGCRSINVWGIEVCATSRVSLAWIEGYVAGWVAAKAE